MGGHTHATAAVTFWPLALMWVGMMAAMMAPTAWPWVRAFHRLHSGDHASHAIATTEFAVGYLLAWLGYALAAALVQSALRGTALMPPPGDFVVARAGAILFLMAGVYQFAPLKRACLTHCRTPIGYFLTHWRDGAMRAVRMGVHHGLFCVGCCWALMATAFAVGVMNVWWMALLAVVALAEQVAPHGTALRRAVGGAFLVAGLLRLTA